MKLLTKAQYERLIANAVLQDPVRGTKDEIDFKPVVKLFNPYGLGTWLLTEIDPDMPDIAFGLCDIGYPELGSVSLAELAEIKLVSGFGIEPDRLFTANKTFSFYADEARIAGYIKA